MTPAQVEALCPGDLVHSTKYVRNAYGCTGPLDGYGNVRPGADLSDYLVVTSDQEVIVDQVDPYGVHGPWARVWAHAPGCTPSAHDLDRYALSLVETSGRLW